MSTKFTISLPDDVMLRLTVAAANQLRTPKAQAEWYLIEKFRDGPTDFVERGHATEPAEVSNPEAPEGEAMS